MGSSQSTPERISIDEHGNISHGAKLRQQTPEQAKTAETSNDSHQKGGDSQSKQPVDNLSELVAEDRKHGEQKIEIPIVASSTGQINLEEAYDTLNRIKSQYQVDTQQNLFSKKENELLGCYASNKSQPLRCADQLIQYQHAVAQHRKQMMSSVTFASTMIAILTTLCLLHITSVQCFGSMSVDLGSEWMKVGLVAPGVQMDIVLNSHSQRKTPMAISYLGGERYIGDAAADIASKYPEKTFTHFLDLVGKSIDHESVKIYKQRFPYANISQHENSTSTIVLNHPEGMSFTPVELIAIMLEHAHDQVLNRLNHLEPVNDVVLTVPPYFNQTESYTISTAAKLIGLNPLQIINTNAAFALSYGVFRHKYDDQGNKTSILFYDQGASSTSATIADYQQIELLNPDGTSKNETTPQVSIRAVTHDRYLGGFDMQLRLRDHLAKAFAKQSGIKLEKILARGKSAAKLLKEAGRVKKVLSANTDYVVRVENVMDDKDLKLAISRQEYEDMCKDLLSSRATRIIEDLMFQTDMTRNDLEAVIIVGGNTRTPKVQQAIIEYMGLEQLGKQINADEGAALAALYQAASLGRGFRVKKFILKDVNDLSATPEEQEQQAQNITIATETENNSTSVENEPLQNIESQQQQQHKQHNIYSEGDLNTMRLRLMHQRQQDILRLQRSSMKNSLESLIGEAREKVYTDEQLKPLEEDINKLVGEISSWIDEGSHELENVTLLAEKYTALHNLITPVVPEPEPKPEPEPEVTLPSASTIEEILSKLNTTTEELRKKFGPYPIELDTNTTDSNITPNTTQEHIVEPTHTEL